MLAAQTRPDRYGLLSVEVPVLLLALGTLVLRIRATEDLAENPVDPAGLFRLACVGGAALLAFISLLTPSSHPETGGRLLGSRLFQIYVLYTFIVFVGAPLSEKPLLTAYRGVELTIVLFVFGAAYRRIGAAAVARIRSILYWFAVAMLCSVWVGVAVVPELAVLEVSSGFEDAYTPIPWQIEGVFPTISANLLGALSALLIFWSIGRVMTEKGRFSTRTGVIVGTFALVTLIAAQYRTGYAAALLAGLVAVILLRKKAVATFVAAAAAAAFISGVISLAPAGNFVLKGQDIQTTSATTLTGRLEWWESSLPVWRESPVIGKGLLTATRFEVLSQLGNERGSTIHSTWVEALLGTGLVGVVLLLVCALWAWGKALDQGFRDRRFIVPPLLLAVMTMRAFTGSTFEIFSYLCLVFFWILLSLDVNERQRVVVAQRVSSSRASGST